MQINNFTGSKRHLFFKIGMPVLLTILLFVFSSFFIIIPSIEKNYMENKRDLIRELTHTAVSTFRHLHIQAERGEITSQEAKQRAIAYIRNLRYGEENKDYFWVTDMKPEMVVHPYRTDLEGQDMTGFLDRSGLPVFVKSVDIVKKRGSGYLTYSWQFLDRSDTIVPKLSYVQLFEPWEWIVGTGVYIEDVRAHIAELKQRLTLISVSITLAICLLLLYVARQSLRIERERNDYADDLARTTEKYKALVQASGEGVILLMEGEELFANKAFREISGYTQAEAAAVSPADLFFTGDEKASPLFVNEKDMKKLPSGPLEGKMRRRDGNMLDVIVSISPVNIDNRSGNIISIKNISAAPEIADTQKAKKHQENLLAELQTALLYLNQPVRDLAVSIPRYETTISIQALSRLMSRHQHTCVLICDNNENPVGIVTDSDIRRRVVSEGIDPSTPVSKIMSFPLISIPFDAMIYEAITRMKENLVRHLLIKDPEGEITHYISAKALIQNHQYSLSFLSQDINAAGTPDELYDLKIRIPQLIGTLINCGVYPRNITRVMSSISDAILNRLISFAIEALGPPPAKFAFIVMGSVGREEQTLKTDQDNAIIFEDTDDARLRESVQSYFLDLGKRVCGWLDHTGYDFCKGDIMAKNPKWCAPISTWKEYFAKWINESEPQDLLETKIFFDFRYVYGEKSLCDQLTAHLDKQIEDKAAFMVYLVQNCLLFKPPIGMFKKLIVEPDGEHREKISLKKCMTPIVDMARIYCLKNKIHAINTLERLERLRQAGVFNAAEYEEITHTYNYLMQIRFRHQSECLSLNTPPDNYIDPRSLTHIDQVMLREVLSSVAGFQARLSNDFRST